MPGSSGSLGADQAGEGDHGVTPADCEHYVADTQDLVRRRPERIAVASHAPDGHAERDQLLCFEHRFAGHAFHAQHATDQQRQRAALAFAHVVLATELLPQLPGGFAQVHAQQPWRELACEQYDRDQAEQVGHAVSRDDIGLQYAYLLRRDAQPRNRFGRGADHGRLRRGAGEQARGRALVQPQQRHGNGQQGQQHKDFHEREQPDAPFASDIGEELGTAGEAQREDEDGERNVLDVVVEAHAALPDDERGDQRAADAAELERAEPDRADGMADREREEERDLRLRGKQA
jgi:hypothetical protein